jgi:hypothetical protein
VAKAQTALRISVPNYKQFFIRLHNADLTRIRNKFSKNEFSHKSCRERPLLADGSLTPLEPQMISVMRLMSSPVRLEVLGEGGSGRQSARRRESIVAGTGSRPTRIDSIAKNLVSLLFQGSIVTLLLITRWAILADTIDWIAVSDRSCEEYAML